MPVIVADIEGQKFPADLNAATALDAVQYEQTIGTSFDVHLAALWLRAQRFDAEYGDDADKQWTLIDRAVIKWLALRQIVDPSTSLADVLASTTFLPIDPPDLDGSGVVAAPEPDPTPAPVAAEVGA